MEHLHGLSTLGIPPLSPMKIISEQCSNLVLLYGFTHVVVKVICIPSSEHAHAQGALNITYIDRSGSLAQISATYSLMISHTKWLMMTHFALMHPSELHT